MHDQLAEVQDLGQLQRLADLVEGADPCLGPRRRDRDGALQPAGVGAERSRRMDRGQRQSRVVEPLGELFDAAGSQ